MQKIVIQYRENFFNAWLEIAGEKSKEISVEYHHSENVEGQEHVPINVAILAAFLIYRYKFVSQAKDKNLYPIT